MSAVRTPWHVYFAIFLKENAPPDIQIKFEVILTTEPQRGDLLLLRRGDAGRRDAEARTLINLWPLLRTDTLAEYKSLAWPLRKGDFARLQAYGGQYFAARIEEGPFEIDDLSLVLIVPTRTPTLASELKRMRWTREPLQKGYDRIVGSSYTFFLVVLEEVSEAERDEIIGLFASKVWTDKQIAWWWKHHAGSLEGVNVQDMEDYKEIIKEMMASLPVETRLAGLAPEERLAGLTLEQQLLLLPDEVLRGLSEDCLRTLPAEVAAAIRARLGRPTGH